MQVSHSEGPANHTGPESCVGICEGAGEALTGERIGQPLSRESLKISGADVVAFTEGNMDGRVSASVWTARRGRRTWHGQKLVAAGAISGQPLIWPENAGLH